MKRLKIITKSNIRKFISKVPYILIILNLFFVFIFKDKDLRKVKRTPDVFNVQLYADENLTQKITLPYYGNDKNSDKEYTVYFRLPKVKDTDVIHVSCRYFSLTADIDGIMFYASDLPVFGKIKTFTGRNQCFIPLSNSCSEGVVTLRFTLQKNLYKTGLSDVTITTMSTYVNSGLRKCFPSLLMALLLLISSLITFNSFIISYFFKSQRRKHEFKLFMSNFLVSISIVCWIFTSFDVIGVILGNTVVLAFLNYISFSLMPVAFSNFLLGIYKKKKFFIKALKFAGLVNLFVQCVLFLFGIFDYTQMLYATHLITLANIITTVIVVVDITSIKEFTVEQKVFCMGSGLFSLCSILGIIIYVINRNMNFMFFISIGLFLFFGMHMVSSMIKLCTELKEREQLLESERNSYKDLLTGAGNRRFYYKKVELLTKNGFGQNLNFIMLDVNGLKVVNDTLGHDAGDELLKGAAFCMRETFPDAEVICRIGGDEFVIIVSERPNILESRIKRFLEYAKNFNGKLIKSISISYGIANLKKYPDYSIEELIKVADKEMYRNKAEYYKDTYKDRRGH